MPKKHSIANKNNVSEIFLAISKVSIRKKVDNIRVLVRLIY